jgi:hypothetical protein
MSVDRENMRTQMSRVTATENTNVRNALTKINYTIFFDVNGKRAW